MTERFPLAAVVGHDDAKLALTLAAIDPRIGGVLLRGHTGSAKTTLARGLAALLDGGRFTELPLGATEDRLIGTLDVAAALAGGELSFRPGLLAAAHQGVLYVDEINLLPDHLVDVLLDVAVSGENVVERDGVSHRHPARFVLVGSMNPEEGELRPQLLDRFGLCVTMTSPNVVDERVEAVRRRLAFDAGTLDVGGGNVGLADRIATARPADVGADVMEAASRLALEVGAEGLRADLTLCRAGAAYAGFERREEATVEDLRRVAHLVLAHRARRRPFDPPTIAPDVLEQALAETIGRDPIDTSDVDPSGSSDGGPDRGAAPDRTLTIGAVSRPPVPPPLVATAARGRFVRDVPASERPGEPIAALSTARALATRRAGAVGAVLESVDLRADVRVDQARRLIVMCVDLSGSMGAPQRAAAASGGVLGLLDDAYQRRHRVALVGFHGDEADVVLSPTSSVEVARNRLGHLSTGGTTPLAAGIRLALDVVTRNGDDAEQGLLVVLTDGRATGRPDALDQALDAAATVRHRGVPALVVDCEDGPVRLGLAESLATAMGARHVRLADHDGDVTAAVVTASRC